MNAMENNAEEMAAWPPDQTCKSIFLSQDPGLGQNQFTQEKMGIGKKIAKKWAKISKGSTKMVK